MAEGTPGGLNPTNTDEQKTLMVKVLNQDFDTLVGNSLTYMKSMQDVFARKVSVPADPSASDIVSLAGNLNAVIPAGFLLLHNDLTKGKEEGSEESSDNFSLSSLIGPMLAVAGGAVVAAGIVKGLFGGFSDKTGNKTQELVDDLNDRLSADDLAQDPEVLAAQKKGFITYLKTYYIQQAAAMTISGTLEAVGDGAGKAVGGALKSLFNSITGKEETPNKLQECVNTIMDAVNPEDYVGDSEVDIAVRKGVIGYLKTYFVTQAAAMVEDTMISTAGSAVGTAAGSAVNNLLRGIFGLSPKEATYQKIQDIVDTLIEGFSAEEASKDQDVQDALKNGIVGYITSYFVSQAAAQVLDTAVSSVSSQAGNAVGSFLKSVFTLGSNKVSTFSHIQDIVDTLIESFASESAEKDQTVQDALKQGIAGYITTYFKSQSQAQALDSAVSSVSSQAGNAVGSFLKSIFTLGNNKDTTTQHIRDIVDSLIESKDYEEVSGWQSVQDALKEGVASYIKSYFEAQATASLLDSTTTALAGSAGGAVNAFFTSLFGKAEESDTGVDHIKNIADSLFGGIKEEEVKEWEGLDDVLKESVYDFLRAYFQIQTKVALADSTSTSLASVAGNTVNKFFTSLFGKAEANPSTGGIDALKAVGDKMLGDINAEEVLEWEGISSVKVEAVTSFVKAYMQLQSDAAIKSVEDSSKDEGGFFSSIASFFSGKKADETSSTKAMNKLLEVAGLLVDSMKSSDLVGEESLQSEYKKGVKSFISSYLGSMTSSVTDELADAAEDAWEYFEGQKTKDPSTGKDVEKYKYFYSLVFDRAFSTTSYFPTSSEIGESKKSNIKKSIESLLSSNSDSLKTIESTIASSVNSKKSSIAPTSTIENFFKKIVSDTFSTSSGFPTASELATVKKEGILDAAKTMLNATVSSLKTEVDENKITFNMDTTATIEQDNTTSENTSKMVQTLNQISTLLSELNSYIQSKEEGSTSNNVIVANTDSGRTDNLDVVIPG